MKLQFIYKEFTIFIVTLLIIAICPGYAFAWAEEPFPEYSPEPSPEYSPEPTPEYSPEPSHEYSPEPTAEYSPEPSPEYSPEPTAEYSPEPSPEYSPEPTAEYSPEPSPEYSPEPSPEYSPEPSPEYSPEPSPEYSPEPSPEYSPEPSATPCTNCREDICYTGEINETGDCADETPSGVTKTEVSYTGYRVGASWCGPCHKVSKALEKKGIPDDLSLEYKDIDTVPEKEKGTWAPKGIPRLLIWRYKVVTHADGTVDNLAPVLILDHSGLVKDAAGQYSGDATADLLINTISEDRAENESETPTPEESPSE